MLEQFIELSYWAFARAKQQAEAAGDKVNEDEDNEDDSDDTVAIDRFADASEDDLNAVATAIQNASRVLFDVCARRQLQHRVLMPFVLPRLESLLHGHVERYADRFTKPCVDAANEWAAKLPLAWLSSVLSCSDLQPSALFGT